MLRQKYKKGFTLIELIVVMAIIGILVLLATPKFLGYTKDANVTAMKADTKILSNAALMYNIDNEGFPTDADEVTLGADLTAYLEENGFEDTDTYSSLDKSKLNNYVKNTKNPIDDYVLITSGKLEGEVFHVNGFKDRDDNFQFGMFKASAPVENYTGTDFLTTDNGNGTLTIVGYVGTSKSLRIPSKINGEKVTMLGEDSFRERELTSVILPNGLTFIGESAFIKNNLKSIIIPNTVTSIDKNAFAENDLTSVTIPDSVISIGDNAFGTNRLTSVVIGNSVTTIGQMAFSLNQLTSLTIPNSVTSIGEFAFGVNDLTSVTIPANVSIQSETISSTFNTAYNNASKAAGTYTAPAQDGTWTKQ